MSFCNSLSYVYGAYLMSPHLSTAENSINKNSFGRLINSYYGKHSLFKKTLPCVYNSGLLTFNEETKDIIVSLDSLMNSKELYHTEEKEELEEALTAFVEDYNTLIQAFSDAENEEFAEKTGALDGISLLHSEALESVGIIRKEDQTLSLDQIEFQLADSERLQELFFGENSFAAAIKERAAQLGKEALSLIAPTPKFYEGNGIINYTIFSGVLFSTYC